MMAILISWNSKRLLFTLLLCLVVGSIDAIDMVSYAKDLSRDIGIVRREKERLESNCRTLIKENKPDSAKYRIGKFYFIEARAGFNGWIETIVAALNAGKKIDEIDSNIPLLSSAIEKNNRFVTYVRSGTVVYDSWKKDVADIATEILTTVIGLWNGDKKALKEQLENLRVVSFEEIEMTSR